MIDRRKILLTGLAGITIPFCAVLAQPAPDDRRAGTPAGRPPASGDHPGPANQPNPTDHPGSGRPNSGNPGPDHPGRDQPGQLAHAPVRRPHMPPPRHEVRPRPPSPRGYRWRSGTWRWNGRQWVWVAGRWYR
jgi:hypothetical protein